MADDNDKKAVMAGASDSLGTGQPDKLVSPEIRRAMSDAGNTIAEFLQDGAVPKSVFSQQVDLVTRAMVDDLDKSDGKADGKIQRATLEEKLKILEEADILQSQRGGSAMASLREKVAALPETLDKDDVLRSVNKMSGVVFDGVDTNKDGFVERTEVNRALTSFASQGNTPARARE